MPRALPLALTIAALVWVGALVGAPYALTSRSPRLVQAAAVVYAGAGLICHQKPERSFHLAGVQLPVCARCSGLYVSGAVGAWLAWLAWIVGRPRRPARTREILAAAAFPTAFTVAIEFLGLAHPSNMVRAVCAMPLGGAAAWIFVQSLRAELMALDRVAPAIEPEAIARTR